MIWANMQSAPGTEWLLISTASFHFHFSYRLQTLQPYVQSGKPHPWLNWGLSAAERRDGPEWPNSLGVWRTAQTEVREQLDPTRWGNVWHRVRWAEKSPQVSHSLEPVHARRHPSQACAALHGQLRVKAPLALWLRPSAHTHLGGKYCRGLVLHKGTVITMHIFQRTLPAQIGKHKTWGWVRAEKWQKVPSAPHNIINWMTNDIRWLEQKTPDRAKASGAAQWRVWKCF